RAVKRGAAEAVRPSTEPAERASCERLAARLQRAARITAEERFGPGCRAHCYASTPEGWQDPRARNQRCARRRGLRNAPRDEFSQRRRADPFLWLFESFQTRKRRFGVGEHARTKRRF